MGLNQTAEQAQSKGWGVIDFARCACSALLKTFGYMCFVSPIAGMPRQGQRAGEMGGIDQRGGRHHRVHILYYDDEGVRRNLYGPFRAERRQAEGDLTAMRAAAVAAEGEAAAAAEAARRQTVVAAMAAVAKQLKTTAAEERSTPAEEADTAAASGSAAPSGAAASADVVVAAPAPYRPCSVDADETWQTERRRRSRDEDAWLNVTGATLTGGPPFRCSWDLFWDLFQSGRVAQNLVTANCSDQEASSFFVHLADSSKKSWYQVTVGG
jgi:hypothetical protein